MCKSNRLLIILAAGATALAAASCHGDTYSETEHEKLINYLSPIDSVDQHHTWQLAEELTFAVTANAGVDCERVEIYDANPLTSSTAQLMNRAYCSQGEQVTIAVMCPLLTSTLYAALVDADGLYTVQQIDTSRRNVDFSSPLAVRQQPATSTPALQTVTYCFEEEFPESGDYDYNDAVVRVALERTGERQLTIHFTLAAVGASKHVAGAMRLVGIGYQDIDSVVAVGGRTYNENVPQPSYSLIDTDDLLMRGRNGEAVLNLFVDAHWAMGENLETYNGIFQRKKYNVSKGSSSNYQQITTRERSYVVYLRDGAALNTFTPEQLDPFIITYYLGTVMETHTDQYSAAQIFYDYHTLNFKDLPWALMVPSGDFRYPLEGVSIGFRKVLDDGTKAMFGAYMTVGHSFGEWAEDHTRFLDWPNYPELNQVY